MLGWRFGVVRDLKSSLWGLAGAEARRAFLMPFARPPPKTVKNVGAIVLAIMRVMHRISAPATVIDAAPLS